MDRLDKTLQRIDKFNLDRDWNQFHSPENLSKSISIEAAELLECFQWDENNYDLEAVKEELADVMNYCLQMALVLKLDPIEIIKKRLIKMKRSTQLKSQREFQLNIISSKRNDLKSFPNKSHIAFLKKFLSLKLSNSFKTCFYASLFFYTSSIMISIFLLVKSIKIAPSGAVTKIAITLAARTS